jgi:hypothetical protein
VCGSCGKSSYHCRHGCASALHCSQRIIQKELQHYIYASSGSRLAGVQLAPQYKFVTKRLKLTEPKIGIDSVQNDVNDISLAEPTSFLSLAFVTNGQLSLVNSCG